MVKPGSAHPRYYDWWLQLYSVDSTAGDAICQVCHESSAGGNGWNRYGFSIKTDFNQNQLEIGTTFTNEEEAFKTSLTDQEATLTDSGNAGSNTFVQEIQADAQTGWRLGEVNLIQFSNGSPNKVIGPPDNLPCGILVDPNTGLTPCPVANPKPTSVPKGNISIKLETIASGFTAPVLVLTAPGESDSLYVVEQGGRIWSVDKTSGNKLLFLDLSAELVNTYGQQFGGYDERGLLGLAFHPGYATNHKIYTYISKTFQPGVAHFSTMPVGIDADHLSVVSEWTVANTHLNPASATAEIELLIVDQPQFNHNGGMVEFGPDDYLYISLGDGGSADDKGDGHGANGNGRDNSNPLGAILRIDVNAIAPANGRYGIPQDNPFVGTAGLDEIVIFGLRNPFRFSFESLNNNGFNLYVGDVGQNAIEEVNRIHSNDTGGNYGWNFKEGSFYFYSTANATFVSSTPPPGVVLPPLIDPVAEYDHDEGISVIGGQVYQGNQVNGLQGKYVFGDWGRSFSNPGGRLFYLDNGDLMKEFQYDVLPDIYITGLGADNENELYVVGS